MAHNGRGQKVHVDPTQAESVQSAFSDELDDLTVRNYLRVPEQFVCGQELRPATQVSDQKLAHNEIMTSHLIAI